MDVPVPGRYNARLMKKRIWRNIGHTVHLLCGERRLPGIGRGRARYDAAAWRCPQDGRLYSISCSRPAKSADVEPILAGARLSCCAALQLPI